MIKIFLCIQHTLKRNWYQQFTAIPLIDSEENRHLKKFKHVKIKLKHAQDNIPECTFTL